MGNAPQSRPPRPNDHRVVIPITTTAWPVGTRLRMLPPLCHGPTSNSDLDVALDGDNDVVPTSSSTTAAAHPIFPPQLEDTPISRHEYNHRMQELDARLAAWKGGWALAGLFFLSTAILVAFVVAYCTPAFWTSPLFDHPFYTLLAGAAFLFLYLTVVRCTRSETERLFVDVEDMFRPWRAAGVLVVLKRVSNIERRKHGPTIRDNSRSSRGYSGVNCFCLLMATAPSSADADSDEEGGDHHPAHHSVGTIDTEDDIEAM